jgi:hypothetical protein
MEPGRECGVGIETGDRPESRNESLLNGVVSVVLIAQQPPRRRQHPGSVTLHQRFERFFVTRLEAFDKIVLVLLGVD